MQDKRYKHLELQKKNNCFLETEKRFSKCSWDCGCLLTKQSSNVDMSPNETCTAPVGCPLITSWSSLHTWPANPPKDYEETLMQLSLQSLYDSGERSNLETECNLMRNNSLPVFSRIPDLIIRMEISWSLLGPGVEVGLTLSFIDYVRLSLK